jgi:pilus assembly protein CpaC
MVVTGSAPNIDSGRLTGSPWFFGLILSLLGMAWPSVTLAAIEKEQVPIHKGRVLKLPQGITSVAIANADIAEVQKLDASHLYVLGKRVGDTNIVLCTAKDCFKTIEVEVTPDLEGLREKLHEVFPGEHPSVYASQGAIVLAGQVSSIDKMNGILSIAGTFAFRATGPGEASSGSTPTAGASSGGATGTIPGAPTLGHLPVNNIVNLMQVGGPQQVMLGVTVAEIARSLTRRIKVDFTAFGGSGDISGGALGAGQVIQALKSATQAMHPASLFLNFLGRDATVQTVINAAKENGLAKILAEPNLTTISGQDAEFVSGGEFPIPVPQYGAIGGTGGGITVIFKEYGVILKFIPVVLNSGRISLKLNIAVSELDPTHSISLPGGNNSTYYIPALTKRNASSAMELDDGQTLGIAGLISDNLRETISKFPGLGDLPILGQLFTSQDYIKNETELMIFVTPHLVKPMDAENMRVPTDSFSDPTDVEFFLQGRTEGRAAPPQRKEGDTNRYGGGLRGHFGQGL